jgi:hypothetical protein
MKIKDFSKNSFYGQQNIKEFKEIKGKYRTAIMLYIIASTCSLITSSYSAFITTQLGIIALVLLGESTKIIAAIKPYNKTAMSVGIAISICTASFSSWLFFQSNNQTVTNQQEIIQQLEKELGNLKIPDISHQDLLSVQDQITHSTHQLNKLLTKKYRVKLWNRSKTKVLTGQQILDLRQCGISTVCAETKAKIAAIIQTQKQQQKQQGLIKAGLENHHMQQQRYQEVQAKIIALKQEQETVYIPILIQICFTIALILVIDYLQFLCRVAITVNKPDLEILRTHYQIWKVNQKSKPKRQEEVKQEVKPKRQEEVKVVKTRKKTKPLDEEGIKLILQSLSSDNMKQTQLNIKKKLKLFGFGQTTKNYYAVKNFNGQVAG